MKKFLLIVAVIIASITFGVHAETKGVLTVDKSDVKIGETFTVRVNVTDAASWNVHVVVDGAIDESCVQRKITVDDEGTEKNAIINEANVTEDTKNTDNVFEAVCKATAEGEITLTLFGDITSEDGESIDLSGTKSVLVGEGTIGPDEPVEPENPNNEENPDTGAFLDITLIIVGGCAVIGLMTYINKKRAMI